MSALIAGSYPSGTSGGGGFERVPVWVIQIGGTFGAQGTTTVDTQNTSSQQITILEPTSSGFTIPRVVVESSTALNELRRRSGLTWDQLARLFGVARRSVHFWASGKPMNAVNQERLGKLLAVIRYIDQGSARATREVITSPLSDGDIPFDLLANGEFDEVKRRLAVDPQRHMPTLTPLSAATRAARIPPPPDERVGALEDTIHREGAR